MNLGTKRNLEGICLILAASSGLIAQSVVPVTPPSYSTAPDARQIMEASTAATQRHWRARLHYTYVEREESRRRDLDGRLKSEDVDVSTMIQINGVPYGRLVVIP